MTKQVLDVHQMQHLQELGLELKETMLYWVNIHKEKRDWFMSNNSVSKIYADECLPAYTLQDVLDALPKEIMYENKRCWASIDLEDGFIGYYYENYSLYYKWAYFEAVMKDESIIDAAYELLVWCIENCYVETNKNE